MGLYLSFSDAAKYADIARNILMGNGFTSDFTFFNLQALNINSSLSVASWVSPVYPYLIALSFMLFGISDLSVILVSSTFFVLAVVMTYLLGKKVGGKLVGILSALAVAFNLNLIDYATSGASETLITFEIILAFYLLSLKKRLMNVLALVTTLLIYFTRPQAIVYILPLAFYYLILNYKIKKALTVFFGLAIVGPIVFVLFFKQGVQALFAIAQNLPGQSASDSLRGATTQLSFGILIKKVFYNLYNFYKLLPQILSPYLLTLFTIGLLVKEKSRKVWLMKISIVLLLVLVLISAALTVPFFRYIHPIVPLVYIFAVEVLIWIVEKLSIDLRFRIYELKIYITKDKFVILLSLIFILIFVVGQTLGVIFLDSRFKKKDKNMGKPPIYVVLSRKLKEITRPDDVIVTNLDTWGTWYGERKTIWFPLRPEQLIDPQTGKIPFNAIYLTSYKMDDPNNYMGDDWRQIFNNPEHPEKWNCLGCGEIASEFEAKQNIDFPASENYEGSGARAILLVNKKQL